MRNMPARAEIPETKVPKNTEKVQRGAENEGKGYAKRRETRATGTRSAPGSAETRGSKKIQGKMASQRRPVAAAYLPISKAVVGRSGVGVLGDTLAGAAGPGRWVQLRVEGCCFIGDVAGEVPGDLLWDGPTRSKACGAGYIYCTPMRPLKRGIKVAKRAPLPPRCMALKPKPM